MTHVNTAAVVTAGLTAAGTVTFPYPNGYDAGHFQNSVGHKCSSQNNDNFTLPANFTLTFGTSNITLTSVDMELPVDTTGIRLNLQLELPGNRKGDPDIDQDSLVAFGAYDMGLALINLGAPDTADANGIVESQSVSSGEEPTLNGTLADGQGNAYPITLDVPRNIVASWTTTATLTVVGKDVYGKTMIESSADGTSFTGAKAFKTITSITWDDNVTSATVGFADVLGLPAFVVDESRILAELVDGNKVFGEQGIVRLMDHALEAAVDGATGLNFVCPVAGTIKKMTTIARAGITTGGAITLEVNTVAVNGLSVTVADSSSEGDVDSDTPTAGHATTAVAVGDRLEVVFASAFNSASDIFVIIEIEPTHTLHGTFVAGVNDAPTATTGDVRGTYDPATACDGSTAFQLVAMLADPAYKGLTQYSG